jgi:hypothetical protein
MSKSSMTRPVVILLMKRTAIAGVLVLVATAVQAQQQASCEQNRLKCQKDWAQTNSFGVPVTPPDKTKLCWDGFYACTGAGPPTAQPPAPPPTAACEQQRLTCQKTWAQNNSSGVPVTPPDKTKLCWDGYNACVAAGNAKPDEGRTTASLPAMKRFEMRSDNYVEECRVDGTEVSCKVRMERLSPPLTHFERTMTGQLSGAVIVGALSWRVDYRYPSGCSSHEDVGGPVTLTLRPNGEASAQPGLLQMRTTIGGPAACGQSTTQTLPGTQATMSWRAIE